MLRQIAFRVRDHRIQNRFEFHAGIEFQDGYNVFAVKLVRNADHGHFRDAGDVHERFFNGRGADVYTPTNDEILLAAGDEERSAFVEMADVASRKPGGRIYL